MGDGCWVFVFLGCLFFLCLGEIMGEGTGRVFEVGGVLVGKVRMVRVSRGGSWFVRRGGFFLGIDRGREGLGEGMGFGFVNGFVFCFRFCVGLIIFLFC